MNVRFIEDNASVIVPVLESNPVATRSHRRRLPDYRYCKASIGDNSATKGLEPHRKAVALSVESEQDSVLEENHDDVAHRRRRTDLLLNGRDEETHFCLRRRPIRRAATIADNAPMDNASQCNTEKSTCSAESTIVSQVLSSQVKILQGLGTALKCKSPKKDGAKLASPKRISPLRNATIDTDTSIGLKGIKALMLKQEGPVLPQSNRTLPQTHATYECKEVLSYESGGVAPHTPQTETKRPVRRRGRTHSVDIGAASNGKREQMRGTEKAPARALPRRAKSDDSLAYMLPSNTAATANCSNRPAYGLDCEVLLTRDRLKATQDIDVDFSPLKTSPRTFADKRPSMIEGIVGLSGIQALANSSRQMKEIAVDFSPLQSTPRSSENRRVIAVGSMSAFLSTPSQGDAAAAVPNTSKETIHWSPIYHSPVKVSKRARDCPSRNRSDGVPKREAVRSRNGQFLAPTRSKSDEGLFHMAYLATSTRGNQNRDKPPRPRARTNDEQTVNGSVDDTSVQDIAVDFSPVKTPLSRTADDRRPSLMEELVGLNGVESLVQQVAINELVALHASMLDGDGYDVVTAMKDDLMAASNGIDCDRSSNTSVVKPKTDRALCQPNRSRSGNIARRTSSNTHGPRRGVTRRHTSDCTLLQMACIASSVADEAKDVKPPAVAVMVEPTEEHPVDAPLCITHDKSQDQHQLEGASLQNLLNDLKCFSGHTRVRRASTASMAAGPIPESTSKLDSLATDTVAVELDTSLHKPTPTLKTSTYEGVQHSKKVIYIDKRRPASAVSDINTEHVESKSRLASILNAPRSRPLDESFASSMLFETSMSFDLSTIERRHSQVSRPTENGTACQPLPDPPTPDTSESFDSGFTDSAKHKSIVASLSPTTNPSKFKRDVINSDRFGRGRGLTNLEKP